MVEEKFGRLLETTNDFEEFSLYLEEEKLGTLSVSTLKRLWGYVNDFHKPRITTLDVLSCYIGHTNFRSFCVWLKSTPVYNSSFFSARCVDVSELLSPGDEVEIGWAPNRYLRLGYRGGALFEVRESKESKLQAGDSFETTGFVLGQPLLLAYVMRDGTRMPPFIGGRNGGLTMLNYLRNGI